MKRYGILFYSLAALVFASSCDTDSGKAREEAVGVETLAFSLGGLDSGGSAATRLWHGYAVNDEKYDPTTVPIDPSGTAAPVLAGDRSAWMLDLAIYRGSTVYEFGEATFLWNGTDMWVPQTDIYFPNYSKQNVAATLYPVTPDAPIALDQSDPAVLLAQDILIQNNTGSNPYAELNPAHILVDPAGNPVPMRHANAMLDFMLGEVEPSHIASVDVLAGTDTYVPYKVARTDNPSLMEYMVILPVDTKDPKVRVETAAGAVYTREIKTGKMAVNTACCATLYGVELSLSSVTVLNWAYGTALDGQYSTVTSYPTFRGRAFMTITLAYDNGMTQDITFNSHGEATVRPLGRTITALTYDNDTRQLSPVLRLNDMIVDLSPLLNQYWP